MSSPPRARKAVGYPTLKAGYGEGRRYSTTTRVRYYTRANILILCKNYQLSIIRSPPVDLILAILLDSNGSFSLPPPLPTSCSWVAQPTTTTTTTTTPFHLSSQPHLTSPLHTLRNIIEHRDDDSPPKRSGRHISQISPLPPPRSPSFLRPIFFPSTFPNKMK